MRYLLIILLLLLSCSQLLYAETGGWVTRDGNPVPNSDEMKSINGFGGWLVVTPDSDWEEKWNTSPETVPHFTEAKDVTYGEKLTILPFYINPKINSAGEVNILCDIKVTRPDGSYSINEKGIKCVSGKLQGDSHNVRITSTIIEYVAEENDPPGMWVVEMYITDQIRSTIIPLKTQFNLQKGKLQKETYSVNENRLKSITTQDEFSYFSHLYYLHPQPELITSAINFIGSSDLASNQNAQAPLLMSFSCLFSQYDSDKKKKWENTINNQDEVTKSLLNRSINQTPGQLLDAVSISPAKNDMNWACFFATGDLEYIQNIISTLNYMEEREDINLFMTAASAKWSLSSNARNHPKVRMAIEENLPLADNIIGKEPQEIREEVLAILKEQKKKGIW